MDPFYIFGIHLNTILIISIAISVISFIIMIFSVDVGRAVFKFSIGLLIFCIIYWFAILFYYLFGFSDNHFESFVFYVILILLLIAFSAIYVFFDLGKAFFD